MSPYNSLSKLTLAATAALVIARGGVAWAQTAPVFSYAKADEVKDVKEVTWTATTEAGLVLTTGNSKTTTATGAAKFTRVDPKNKLDLGLMMAYARSTIRVASDANMNGTIGAGEVEDSTTTTANAWQAKLRYDRFLTMSNSLYIAGAVGADRPAGKDLVGGGQLGYSRRLFKDDEHEVLAEIGYDLSYEDRTVGDGVAIHSVRGFTGYKGKLNDKTAIEGSVELLSNVNALDIAPEEAGAFDDTRVNGAAGLTTKITDDISLNVSFGLKYDNRPAPRAPFALPYDAGYVPVADEIDTITKATFIVSLF